MKREYYAFKVLANANGSGDLQQARVHWSLSMDPDISRDLEGVCTLYRICVKTIEQKSMENKDWFWMCYKADVFIYKGEWEQEFEKISLQRCYVEEIHNFAIKKMSK